MRVKTADLCTTSESSPTHSNHYPLPQTPHMRYTAAHKHSILTHYRAGERGSGFHALARRFAVTGGARLIQLWQQQWDGTPQSLERRAVSGRPRALSSREVQRYVRTPLLRANRAHKVVHYPAVTAAVRAVTGKIVSGRTVRHYGKEELGAKQRRGKKRTADECE